MSSVTITVSTARRQGRRGGVRPGRQAVEHLDQRADALADVALLARLVLAGAEQLVGDVERGQRQRGQRILHAAAGERADALFEISRELAQVLGRGLGTNRRASARAG